MDVDNGSEVTVGSGVVVRVDRGVDVAVLCGATVAEYVGSGVKDGIRVCVGTAEYVGAVGDEPVVGRTGTGVTLAVTCEDCGNSVAVTEEESAIVFVGMVVPARVGWIVGVLELAGIIEAVGIVLGRGVDCLRLGVCVPSRLR